MVSAGFWSAIAASANAIMGIGASTNVKEIRIDPNNAKLESFQAQTSLSSLSKSRAKQFGNLGRRWINSAEASAKDRRFQQLNTALESTEKRAQEAEQRTRFLERELATLEMRNVELANEVTWLKKQLSNRPEVPVAERPTTTGKHVEEPGHKQVQYIAKLEEQMKLYEQDILKLKTKLNKDTQRLQAELEDQKHRSEKELRLLDNRLIEMSSLNQKYEEVISSKLSADLIEQMRSELMKTGAVDAPNGQVKNRAQLILELSDEISLQQEKIRRLEEEIVGRDIELAHLKTMVQHTERAAFGGNSGRQPPPRSARRTFSKLTDDEEIDALFNDDDDDDRASSGDNRSPELSNNWQQQRQPKQRSNSQFAEGQRSQQPQQPVRLSASLYLPTSWRATDGDRPPSNRSPEAKSMISVTETVHGNNLGGLNRPKTCAGRKPPLAPSARQNNQTMSTVTSASVLPPMTLTSSSMTPTMTSAPVTSSSMVAAHAVANADAVDKPRNSFRRSTSRDLATMSRVQSAPMFAFRARPTGGRSSTVNGKLPTVADRAQSTLDERRRPPPTPESLEVMSLHEAVPNESALGFAVDDSSTAVDDDDDDDEGNTEEDSDNDLHRTRGHRPVKLGPERGLTSAKSRDSGFLGDSCTSSQSLRLWTARSKRNGSQQNDVFDIEQMLEIK